MEDSHHTADRFEVSCTMHDDGQTLCEIILYGMTVLCGTCSVMSSELRRQRTHLLNNHNAVPLASQLLCHPAVCSLREALHSGAKCNSSDSSSKCIAYPRPRWLHKGENTTVCMNMLYELHIPDCKQSISFIVQADTSGLGHCGLW